MYPYLFVAAAAVGRSVLLKLCRIVFVLLRMVLKMHIFLPKILFVSCCLLLMSRTIGFFLACCKTCGFGCNGGFPQAAWSFFKGTGLVTGGNYDSNEGCRPYTIEACDHQYV